MYIKEVQMTKKSAIMRARRSGLCRIRSRRYSALSRRRFPSQYQYVKREWCSNKLRLSSTAVGIGRSGALAVRAVGAQPHFYLPVEPDVLLIDTHLLHDIVSLYLQYNVCHEPQSRGKTQIQHLDASASWRQTYATSRQPRVQHDL